MNELTYRGSSGRALTDYPRPSVAVDTAVLSLNHDVELVVLEVRRATGPGWALPGTFLHVGETLADAVDRSLREKAYVRGLHPRQLHVFDDPHRDYRGWVLSVAHVDVVAWPRIASAATSRDDVHLVPVDEAVGMPFDHDTIVAMAVEHLREPYRSTPDPARLLPSPFTLLQLRRLHEAVLGHALVKDTFRRRMQPLLVATERIQEGEVGKPALLFRHPEPLH